MRLRNRAGSVRHMRLGGIWRFSIGQGGAAGYHDVVIPADVFWQLVRVQGAWRRIGLLCRFLWVHGPAPLVGYRCLL